MAKVTYHHVKVANFCLVWSHCYGPNNIFHNRAVVVAQLVAWSHLIPEVRGLNPVIGKNYIEHLLSTLLKRRK